MEQGDDSDRELRDEIERSITKSQEKSQELGRFFIILYLITFIGFGHLQLDISLEDPFNTPNIPTPTYGSPEPGKKCEYEKDYVTFGKHLQFDTVSYNLLNV